MVVRFFLGLRLPPGRLDVNGVVRGLFHPKSVFLALLLMQEWECFC